MKYYTVLAVAVIVALWMHAANAQTVCPFNPNPPPRDHMWTCVCDQNGQNCRVIAVRIK